MGKSRFPGKPSKSHHKRHISVLTGKVICEGDAFFKVEGATDRLSVLQKTFGNQNRSSDDTEHPATTSELSSECDNANIATLKVEMPKECSKQKSSARVRNRQKNDNSSDEHKNADVNNKKPKKSVTFRSILESYSDSVGSKKKSPQIHDLPLIPIIKKNTSHYYKNDSIVKPSKLNDISAKFSISSKSLFNQKIDVKSDLSADKDKEFSNAVGGFTLPVRSVHSSRVIKPNKRFIETEQSTNSDVNKLGIKKPRLPISNDETNEICAVSSPQDAIDDHGDNNNTESSMGQFLWHTLRPNVDKQMFSKKIPLLKDSIEKGNPGESSDLSNSSDSELSQDFLTTEEDYSNDSNSELDGRHSVKDSLPPTMGPTLGKNILRKARLQLQDTAPVGNEGPFSASITNNNNSVVSPPGTVTCGVCGAVRFYRFVRQARKFGIYSCESCRKFISKMVKKQAVISSTTDPIILQCHKGDGSCQIPPILRNSQWKLLRCARKRRCPACWLKLCLGSFQIPQVLQSRLISTLPAYMQEAALENLPKLEIENNPSIAQMFPSRLGILSTDHAKALNITGSKRVPIWSQEHAERLDANLQETILNEMSDVIKSSDAEKVDSLPDLVKDSIPMDNKRKHMTVRVRKKADAAVESKPIIHPSAETTKRQRIDLKGPRVKHVCRSASIVLGQPMATFANENDSETTTIGILEAESSPAQIVPEMKVEDKIPESIFRGTMGSVTTNDQINSELESIEDAILPSMEQKAETLEKKVIVKDNIITENKDELVESSDKLIVVGTHRISNKHMNNEVALVPKKVIRNLNVSSYNMGKKIPTLSCPISVDFWENYDPVEVSATGFGLIGSDLLNILTLCFLCGASGTGEDRMIYCSCCCEPYHWYCVEDNVLNYYCGNSNNLDVTESSLFDMSISSLSPFQNGMWRLNWLCPRCTVCQSCGIVSGTKLSCRKCHRSYHSSCVNTKSSKGLIGSDRPWICPPCLKCKSCGSSSVAKYIGNMPLCSSCFKLRQKGSYCPLCQRCYEDNDYNTKMMECGECKRWIHSNCEGLSDEKYQLLSTLPESIEFVCRKCFNGDNSCWREAIDMELKNGFQSILRALSKNREACALLKWSPRKKTVCSCRPINSAKSIKFPALKEVEVISYSDAEDSDRCYERLPQYSASILEYNCIEPKDNVNQHNEEQNALDMELQNAVSSIEISDSWKPDCDEEMKLDQVHDKDINDSSSDCSCNKTSKQIPTLLDIKRKVICQEYKSLSDFNSDMLAAIEFTKCDDLYNTYNHIVHDNFPWFTNDLVETDDKIMDEDLKMKITGDTFTNIKCEELNDQEVPCGSVPFDDDSYFYEDHVPAIDMRLCLLCKGTGDGIPLNESRLLYCGHNEWVHANCALWSAEVFEEIDGSLQNVHSAISRGKLIRCTHCNMKGASVGCCARNCSDTFHYPCARNFGCAFMDDKTVYCPLHIMENVNNKSQQHDKDFEINRPVYVELDRKKKKFMECNRLQFLVGSLRVKNIGKFVTALSDTSETIVPLNFLCTRMFWSIKEPWKIIEYTIKTSVFVKKPQVCNILERNFTVDHTREDTVVQCHLNEVVRFHKSIESHDQIIDQQKYGNARNKTKIQSLGEEKTVKIVLDQMLDTVCKYEDDTCDEEPQNTADLLSPELEDEIYEDLERDLLDGISMLDIFPKLMNYDDFTTIDGNSNRDAQKDDLSESRYDGKVRKDVDNNQNDSWFDSKTSEIIDDLFPTSKAPRITRVLKRSKSEVLPKKVTTVGANRSHQRSCSLTWNCKLDGNVNFKKRKMSQNRNVNGDLSQCEEFKKPESLTFKYIDSSEMKKEVNKNFEEQKLVCSNDIKTAALERIKISQLDGADDASDGSEYETPAANQVAEEFHEQLFHNTYAQHEMPVKCERCHCTYRTHDSFQRHLASCETLTSESESELPHSPEMRQENMTISQDGVMIMQNMMATNTFMPESQQQQVQNITIPVQSNQAPISIMPNFNISGNQITFNNTILQNTNGNNPVVSYDCSNNLQNIMMANPHQANMQFGQTTKFTHPHTIQIDHNQRSQQQNIMQPEQNVTSQFQQNQTLYPAMSIANQLQNTPQIIQTLPNNIAINQIQQQSNSTTLMKAQNSVNYQTCQIPQQQQNINQPRIITFSNPQQMVSAQNSAQTQPFAISQNGQIINFTMNQPIMASPQKKQLILPQPMRSPPKRQNIIRMPVNNNNRNRAKISPRATSVKRPIRPDKPIMTNQGIQLNRPIILQQNQNPSIIVQQLSNPNIMSYVEQTGNVQYITTMNSENDFKQPTQYLTPNPLVPGTFQLHTDQGNLLTLSNNGISVLPNMQLAQTQPTVLGTIIQPQNGPLQCGMMPEQLVLQQAPLEMVTDASGCMYLTSQPVYYGLETIVQNTVMQSQQFVSTAMQGMLSSNSSFSATTTQVFQASKIEPIVDIPGGYVVVNNMPGDNIMQSQTNLIQQLHPQTMQTNSECITNMPGSSDVQSNSLQFNNFDPIQKQLQITSNQVKNNMNLQLLPKLQNQIVNKVIPSNNQQIRMTVDNDMKINSINTKDMIQQVHFSNNKNQIFENSQLVSSAQNNMQFSQIHFNKKNTTIPQKSLVVERPLIMQKAQIVKPVSGQINHVITPKIKENGTPTNKVIKNNKIPKSNTHLVQPIQNKSMPLLNVDNPPAKQLLVMNNTQVRKPRVNKNQNQQIVQPILQKANSQCSPKIIGSNTLFPQPNHGSIPTNIVNPIQQISSSLSSPAPAARPMNRVLPMQTSLHKESTNNKLTIIVPQNEPSQLDIKLKNEQQPKLEPVDKNLMKNIIHENAESSLKISSNSVEVTSNILPEVTDMKKTVENINKIEDTCSPVSDTNKMPVSDKVLNNNTSKTKPLAEKSVTYKLNNSVDDQTSLTNMIPPTKRYNKQKTQSRSKENDPKIIFEVHSKDGFAYSSNSISDLWLKVLESVQQARKNHGLSALPQESIKAQLGYQTLGLNNNALRYLLEQLPGANKCVHYKHRYHKPQAGDLDYENEFDVLKENVNGAIRCETYKDRSHYDMFSWLASTHRQRPPTTAQTDSESAAVRRASSTNLPVAMRYRYLKETSKETVGVFRSLIHGRGLFCRRAIESGEMVIEYAGEVIRATLTDKREKYYDSKGIGCYMFRIDDQFVVDATMRGNAARFINHSCEPNCYSKVIDVLGHKHIVIFALRRILQGEELTYDYKFPFEDIKIPCTCGSRKCRKYLN